MEYSAVLTNSHKVVSANKSDLARWNEFVESSAEASCFHWYGWRHALEGVLGYECHYLMALDSNEKVRGVFPIAVVRSRLFGDAIVALPFCTYGGPVSSSGQVENLLWESACELADKHQLRLETRRIDPSGLELPSSEVYFQFKRALPATLEGMQWLPSKRRNMVRRASSKGLSSTVSKDADAFFELYAENARAHGTPALPKRFFSVLLDSLGDKVDILFVKNATATPISCIMNFYHGGEIHAGFAGELGQARDLSANDFKYWSLVEHAVAKRCTVFDFGRSKVNTGSFEFKRLWGFTPERLHYEYRLQSGQEVPSNNPNNPKFQIAIRVWSKLPRFVVDRLGPRLIHGLG